MDSFGNYLRNIRKEVKLTQIEAASEIGVSRNAIQDWEKDAYIPEEEKISRLSRAYHVPKENVIHMLKIYRQKEERKVYNWPDFLFDEDTNEIVKNYILIWRIRNYSDSCVLWEQLLWKGSILIMKKLI